MHSRRGAATTASPLFPSSPLRVLLRDALFLLADKPAGLLSVPGRARGSGAPTSAAELAAAWAGATPSQSSLSSASLPSTSSPPPPPPPPPPERSLFRSAARAGLLAGAGAPLVVHRLDEATSGLLLLPRSRGALSAVATLFVQRRVRKGYVAVLDTRGGGAALDAGEGVIDTPLGPNSHVPVLQTWGASVAAAAAAAAAGDIGGAGSGTPAPGRGLKSALTRWRVLERGVGSARVLLRPETGRTHQLRLHCALPPPLGLGSPVVGDRFYGDPRLCEVSYQTRLTDAVTDDGAGSVAALLKALDARRRTLATYDDMPRLASCAYIDGSGGGTVRSIPRMLLHASELSIPDDFGGCWEEGLEEEGPERAGADRVFPRTGPLAIPPPLADLRGEDAGAAGPETPAPAVPLLTVSATVEDWPRFGFRNAPNRRPAPRRVLHFALPAPF